jgi:hypothetical protein
MGFVIAAVPKLSFDKAVGDETNRSNCNAKPDVPVLASLAKSIRA